MTPQKTVGIISMIHLKNWGQINHKKKNPKCYMSTILLSVKNNNMTQLRYLYDRAKILPNALNQLYLCGRNFCNVGDCLKTIFSRYCHKF